MNFEIDNHKDALTLALQLAVTAPNDALAQIGVAAVIVISTNCTLARARIT